MSNFNRRQFLTTTGAMTAGMMAGSQLLKAADEVKSDAKPEVKTPGAEKESAAETVSVGIMGVNGRGKDLAKGLGKLPNCRILMIADVDERAAAAAADQVEKATGHRPETVGDFRKILENNSVDALVIAAPDHWHAPAAILACTAKKHVYVEKPCCHNPNEGEILVAAARKNDRVVAMGSQRRSMPWIQEAIEKCHTGVIGKTLYARAWYDNRRKSIGHGKEAEVPKWLDYTLWQGPAPEQAYRDNILHYNWHWFWNWGTGELGNNGIHGLDVCRWALDVKFPQRVVSSGGKYRHDDDQQTPDTNVVSYDFGDKSITWEGLSWSPRGWEGDAFGMTIHGTEGTIAILGSSYKHFDMDNKLILEQKGESGESKHLANWLSAIREHKRPPADIEDGYQSTLLCHLGNISHRVNRVLKIDPANGHILDDADAMKFWKREYRPGWEPKV